MARSKRQKKNEILRHRNAGYISSISIDKQQANKKTTFSSDSEDDEQPQKEELMEDERTNQSIRLI